jgi:hypothetical protein
VTPTPRGGDSKVSQCVTLLSGDVRIIPPAPLPQVDALQCQQQRILHRSALIDYVLAAERQRGQTLTIAIGDALSELLADISEAARTIGTLLQTTTGRP